MIRVLRVYEYDMVCDCCGVNEVLHTGDCPDDIFVHDISSAIKGARFHRSHGQLLCEDCFKNRKKG